MKMLIQKKKKKNFSVTNDFSSSLAIEGFMHFKCHCQIVIMLIFCLLVSYFL